MPLATVRGVDINYEILGERGPWVALQPGGRRGLEGVKPLGEKIAEAGCRVLVYDRRNCGASGVSFDGGNSENEIWAEDLRYAAQRLIENYYTQFIDAAQEGGMEAICRTEHFGELIGSNPANQARLMALDRRRFISIMEHWRRAFNEGAHHPVIGLSPAELRSMTMPACIIPGNDRVHPRQPAQIAHRLMPDSEYHEVLTEDRPDLDVALEDWEAKAGLLAAIFIDFLRRTERRAGGAAPTPFLRTRA